MNIFRRMRPRLEALESDLEAMFLRMRVAEDALGIPGQGPRPDAPEFESNRYMQERLMELAEHINGRLEAIERAAL